MLRAVDLFGFNMRPETAANWPRTLRKLGMEISGDDIKMRTSSANRHIL